MLDHIKVVGGSDTNATDRSVDNLPKMPFNHLSLFDFTIQVGYKVRELKVPITLIGNVQHGTTLIAQRKKLHLYGECFSVERLIVKEATHRIVYIQL